jgi:hypothetical protein
LRKLELTQQRVARIENFRFLASSTVQVVWIVFSAESSDFSWETKSLKLSGIAVRNMQSSRPLLDPFTKNILQLATRCGVSSIFVSRVSIRNGFSKLEFSQRSIHGPACPGPWIIAKGFMSPLNQQVLRFFVFNP